ncbi:hypothetical protein D1007_47457 [Hordeum vulgare]|nr:hypothetical protein D1007_47457 [Hordeum vulgare]
MMLPESPRASFTQPIPGYHVYPQGSRFSRECSPEVRIVAPSTPTPATIDLNATSVARRSSSGGTRKRQRNMPADMLTGARNLFDGMLAAIDDDTANLLLADMISEGGAPATDGYSTAAYDPDEIQSQDGRGPFTQASKDAFMKDLVGLDGFPVDHEFPEDYGLEEEEDDMDIYGEPLFEEELANRTFVVAMPKRKSSEGLGDSEKALPWEKTNSKKEDKRDATSIALLEKVEGMISKKDLREEKRRQEKEEQMNAIMEIQCRRLEVDAERQAKMLELEEAKQAKMLEIEATNAKTKEK